MPRGCLSCLTIICLRKKEQSKKQHKPVKTEDVVEPVGVRDDEEESLDKKTNITGTMGYFRPEYMSSNDNFYGKFGEDDSSSSLKNDFNKVKTFDLRGVAKTEEK
ncbi:hypothetical protein ISN44_As11g021730 [Arabidopsis suecica]|uniref:Uncharacterized protein n=1 Tax=Arabidopsis suecica TaxID=45249 RepID=A0A8T1ZAE0_ARASU|nr:hypothetical protein ISN44_As11g021730 [Arabidopsis suecica]